MGLVVRWIKWEWGGGLVLGLDDRIIGNLGREHSHNEESGIELAIMKRKYTVERWNMF